MATATGDFNGDGKLDLAVGNAASSSISILLGNGDGSFHAGTIASVPGNCLVTAVTAGDFTGDGKLDLLAVCGFQTTIWVLPGLGNGQFGPGVSTQLPQLALVGFAEATFQGLAVADFNGDGKLDIAIALSNSDLSNPNLEVMLGKGNGTFQSPSTVLSTGFPANVVAADMNGDGKPDLVVAVSNTPSGPSVLLILAGDGKGGFQQLKSYTLPAEALVGSTAVVDVNRDGIPDVVVAGANLTNSGNPTSTVTVFAGKGDGTLVQGFSATESNLVLALVAADFRGTGTADLVEIVASSLQSNGILGLSARSGNGDGTFQLPVSLPIPGGVVPWWFGMLSVDWNGDGLPDVAFLSLPSVLSLSGSGGGDNIDLSAVPQLFSQFGAGDLVVMLNAPAPLIAVSHAQLQFSYTAGGAAPATQSLAISNGHTGALNWTASSNASWLTVSPASGTAPGTVNVSVASGLAANTYTGAIEISSSGAVNTPLTVPVTLVVSTATLGPNISAVVNGASFQAGFEAGSWVTIQGSHLSNTSPGRTWTTSEVVNGKLPTALDGTSVTIDGENAYVYYISPTQINVQAPSDTNAGTVNVVVTNNGSVSTPFPATLQAYSPAFFQYQPTPYAIATRYPDNAPIGNPAVISGTVAAKGGDILILWATGFGATSPLTAAGIAVTGAPAVVILPTVTVGGTAVKVLYAVLSPGSAGLYQIAIQLPASVPTGTVAIQASVAGVQSPAGVDLFVGN
jgi:uncharacterized protein (TIGR03437 family)